MGSISKKKKFIEKFWKDDLRKKKASIKLSTITVYSKAHNDIIHPNKWVIRPPPAVFRSYEIFLHQIPGVMVQATWKKKNFVPLNTEGEPKTLRIRMNYILASLRIYHNLSLLGKYFFFSSHLFNNFKYIFDFFWILIP